MNSWLIQPPVNTPARIQEKVQKENIKQELHKIIYIWDNKGTGFWAWINEKNCMYINGYKWNGHSWIKFRMSIDQINNFKEA